MTSYQGVLTHTTDSGSVHFDLNGMKCVAVDEVMARTTIRLFHVGLRDQIEAQFDGILWFIVAVWEMINE